jgi:two-component system, NarL family, nitrate/nitrite response regulator NarP
MMSLAGGPADAEARAAIRLAVADGRKLIAEALGALVATMEGLELVGIFDGAEALPAIVAQDPDVLLVGIGGDATEAFDLVRSLRRIALSLEIVLIADVLTPELVTFVLEHRLNGLILTETPPAELAACLDRVARGHAVLPANWHAVLARHRDDPIDSLSERQLEVLRLVAAGCSYEEIGARLYISANTVKFHLRSIYMRLGVRNRMAAARMLTERGGVETTHSPPGVRDA